ncbi:MAG: hypothetical protein Q9187_003800 [Circinaria calcarea]
MNVSKESPEALNIITLNCWGLKYIAKLRKERIEEIGKRIAIANPVPNIVGLQECWTFEDYKSIRQDTRAILPYGKFYHSGIFGGGLAILSKWPIEESNMVRYPLNGRPTAFFRGDWFVGKGVACARIRIGPGRKDVVEVFCTHLHAPYEMEPHDSYLCHRTAQAWEIAKLMRGAAERGHLVLGLGDFNMVPLSLAHRLITTHAPVKDVWRVLYPDSSIGAAIDLVENARGRPIPDADFNLSKNGTTCDSVLNTWRWRKEDQKKLFKGEIINADRHTPDPRAKRLDYIFFGSERGTCFQWRVSSVKVGMTDRHPIIGCSLSDHFSVEATISRIGDPSISEDSSIAKSDSPYAKEPITFKKPLISNGHSPRSTTAHQQTLTLPTSTYEEILTMISAYTLRERRQRRFRLTHFLVSVPISIGCLTAVFWSPRNFVSFILMLISTFGLSAGIIDGLIGGLFVGSELRALKEFEWEIRNVVRLSGGVQVEEGVEGSLRDWFD